MSDLKERPRVRSLLAELLQLEAADAQLPLQVLVNLYRGRLSAPLDGLILLAIAPLEGRGKQPRLRDGDERAYEVMRERYPQLADGALYEANAELTALAQANRASGEFRINLNDFTERRLLGDRRAQLIVTAARSWQAYDPLVLLHTATLPEVAPMAALDQLEVELGVHPDVRRMILEMAQVADD